MKNTDRTKEIEFSAGSDPSCICVYPVNLWFDCSKLLLKRTVLGGVGGEVAFREIEQARRTGEGFLRSHLDFSVG